MVPVFWCLKFGQLHISVYGQSIRSRTFSAKIPHPCCLSLRPLFLLIQNFFAFFDHTPAIVFSQASDVGLPHRDTQNGCQPTVRIFSGHQAPFVQLIKSPMSFIAQNPQLPIGHSTHGDLRPGMHPDIGITDRIPAANIEHRVPFVIPVNTIGTSEDGMAAAVRASWCIVLSSFLFHHWILPNKKSGRLRNRNQQGERLPLAYLAAEQPSGHHIKKPTPLWTAHR